MIQPVILAQGKFSPKDIQIITHAETARARTPEIDAAIEKEWGELLEEAEREGRRIWNGETTRVEQVRLEGEKLILDVATIDFKTRECLTHIEGYYEWGEEFFRKGGFVTSLVRTTDAYFAFVVLSGKSNNRRRTDMIGGIIGDGFPLVSGEGLYETLYKEMEEEISLPRECVEQIALQLVFLGPSTNVGFYFRVGCKETRKEIETRFCTTPKDHDVAGIEWVHERELEAYMEALGGYKPFLYKALFEKGSI